MNISLSRRIAGGAAAVALATGIALSGTGVANAAQAPANPGTSVGQVAYVQSGSDPTIHSFRWDGGQWNHVSCRVIQDTTVSYIEK